MNLFLKHRALQRQKTILEKVNGVYNEKNLQKKGSMDYSKRITIHLIDLIIPDKIGKV